MSTDIDLLRFVTPDETAAQFLARTTTEACPTGLPVVDQNVQLRPGHVLEVVGPNLSGKSELLVHVRVWDSGASMTRNMAQHHHDVPVKTSPRCCI